VRKLAFVFLVALLGLGAPATARADDNAAVAINTKDGSSIFKFAFSIRKVASGVVDQTNAAVAYSSCTDCQTVAVAIEIVLVTGDPSVVTPTNVAIAINDQCTLCISVADAYQWVLGTGGNVHFSDHGMQEIRRIVNEIRDLGKSGLSAAEIQARLEELVKQLAQVIVDDLVASGQSGEQNGNGNGTTTQPAEPPPQSSTPSTTTAPASTTSTTTTTTTSEPESTTTSSTAETTTTTTGSTTTTP
jgi:putative peptide zinc metalloprotease protein